MGNGPVLLIQCSRGENGEGEGGGGEWEVERDLKRTRGRAEPPEPSEWQSL